MKRPVEVFDDPTAFRRAASGRRPPRAKSTTTTTTEPGQGDQHGALMRLAVLGFMPRWRVGIGFDFWTIDGRATTTHDTYGAAVQAAERELRG